MENIKKLAAVFFLMFFINSQAVNAASHSNSEPNIKAIHQMAEIMLNLNHYPDASEKALLKNIYESDGVSSHVRTLANAMLNLKHYAAAADKEKLQLIINDHSVSEKIRKLASIVHNIAHAPSSADKEDLREIMKQ